MTRSFLLIMTHTRKENDIVCRDLCLSGIAGKRLTYRRIGDAAHA